MFRLWGNAHRPDHAVVCRQMTRTFPVDWIKIFKSVTLFMTIAILLGVLAAAIARLARLDFDTEKAFGHISLSLLIGVLLWIPLFSATLAFFIAYWFKRASITLSDSEIEGRGYWGFKKKIPLKDIKSLGDFSRCGIKAIVVASKHHGKIYISNYTEGLDEIVELLSRGLASSQV
jgi:hypothetical protein